MDYKEFKTSIIKQDGEFYAQQLEHFFSVAVEVAESGKYDEAIIIANDALTLAKYSDVDYEILYLIGMLCQVYLDNDQPELANDFFNKGMQIIEQGESENQDTNAEDINSFLDLKIIIEEELKKKNNH
jgi:hypothetical protein